MSHEPSPSPSNNRLALGQNASGHSSLTEVGEHDHPVKPDWTKSSEGFAEHELETYGGDAPFDPTSKRQSSSSALEKRAIDGSADGHSHLPRLSAERPAKSGDDSDTPVEDEKRESEKEENTKAAAKQEGDPNRVQWAPNDPENPQNMSRARKWFLTFLTIMLAANVTFASSAPSAGLPYIAETFDISLEVANLVTTLMLLGYCAGPLIWAPVSELIGRRNVFIVSWAGWTILQIGDALAKNTGTLLSIRFIAGVFASSPLTVTGGFLVDIWDPVTRGTAITLFSASVFLGPVFGPIVGGFVAEASPHAWRWIFWIIMIWAGIALVFLVFFLPETFSPVLLARRAKKLRAEDPVKNKDLYADHEKGDFSFKGILTRTLLRPFLMLFQESILILTVLYMSVVYGLLYSLFSAFPIIFGELRGFSPGITGLMFIPVGLGTTIGAIVNQYLQRDAPHQLKRWKGFPPPEYRLRGGMLAGPAIVIGSLWLGWAGAYASVPWYVPALGAIVLGTSFTLVFISFLTYTMEVYLFFAASALAANTIVRSAVGAAFPLFSDQMYHTLGTQWACTLTAGIGLLLAPAPFFFYKYGKKIRLNSKWAPALDAKITPDDIESGN